MPFGHCVVVNGGVRLCLMRIVSRVSAVTILIVGCNCKYKCYSYVKCIIEVTLSYGYIALEYDASGRYVPYSAYGLLFNNQPHNKSTNLT